MAGRISTTQGLAARWWLAGGASVTLLEERLTHAIGGGHAVGDLLLVEAAKRIGLRIRMQDTIARAGGDEFGLSAPLAAFL